jgi:hypothetical protein
MKASKKLSKKLTLKKETVVNLKNDEMKSLKGKGGWKTLTVCSACPNLCIPI